MIKQTKIKANPMTNFILLLSFFMALSFFDFGFGF